jgi:hypothetical protein
MIIGNYMLLNLFLAILLKFISESDEEHAAHEHDTKIETPRSGAPAKLNDSKRVDNQNDSKAGPPGLDDSGPLNSSNSNIEEEFE